MRQFLAFALTLLPLMAACAPAPQAANQGIRGVVTDIRSDALVVETRNSKTVEIALKPDWKVQKTSPIGIAAIQPGSFIGTAEIPQKDGRGKSLEVHVFPPGMKPGEGSRAWDLRAGSRMTNGTVGEVKVGANGRDIVVTYPNGTRNITVPPNVPIVQITDGDRSEVRSGTRIFALASGAADGSLFTNLVVIGANGAEPPM